MKDFLMDANKVLSKLDLNMVVSAQRGEGQQCLSSFTDDDLCYVFVRSKTSDYALQDFSFRNWKSLSSILTTCSDEAVITVDVDSFNYPTAMNIKGNGVSFKHYLQNCTFINNQQELANQFKKKRFESKLLEDSNVVIDSTKAKTLISLSSLTNEPNFKIKLTDNNLYFIFGDANKTADNATILISDDFQEELNFQDISYPTSYFVNMATAMQGQSDIKIKVFSNKIIIQGSNEVSDKVVILRGTM